MENSTTTPIVPRLEMASLRQMDQQQHEELYKIREADAQRFLEESLILLLAKNFTVNEEEMDEGEGEEQLRRRTKRRAEKSNSITSINDFLLFWDEDAQQQIHSARSLISERFSADSDCHNLPPKSPRVNGGGGGGAGLKMMMNGSHRLMNALVAKSKLILMPHFTQTMTPSMANGAAIPIVPQGSFQHQQSSNLYQSSSLPVRYNIRQASNEGGTSGRRQAEHRKRQPNWPTGNGQEGGQQLFTIAPPPASMFWLSNQQQRHWEGNGAFGGGGQLPHGWEGQWMGGPGGGEEAGEEAADQRDWGVAAQPAAAPYFPHHQQQQPMTMDPRGRGGRKTAATAGQTLPRPNRSNHHHHQQQQEEGGQHRLGDGTTAADLYCWWSSEDEAGRQKRRRQRGGGGKSVEPPIRRGAGVPGPPPPLFFPASGQGNNRGGDCAEGNRFGENQAEGQPEGKTPAASINGQSANRGGGGGEGELFGGAVADPKVADLLLNYVQNNIEYHRNHRNRPASLIADPPFVNRSKTVPVIKFRYRPQSEETVEEEEEERRNRSPGTTTTILSPVTRSQNLLEAAINSLNQQVEGQLNFEAVSATIKAPGEENWNQIENNQRQQHQQRHFYIQEEEKANTPPKTTQDANDSGENQSESPEDLVRLFRELGFDLNKSISKNLSAAFEESGEMAKTTPNWKNSFASMRERFGGSMDSAEMGEMMAARQSVPTFVTAGKGGGGGEGQQQQQWNSNTMPRRDAQNATPTGFLAKSASGNTLPAYNGGGKRASNPENHFGGSQRNNESRRPSQQGGGSKDISNFWLQMLKTRADANQSPQKLPLGLSAAERLQQLQHEAALVDRQSPSASSSAGSPASMEWAGAAQQQKYPYRRAGGVESVAMRRNNFLAEVQRVESPLMMGGGGGDSGRTTPLMKTLKMPSPSLELDRQNSAIANGQQSTMATTAHFGPKQLNKTNGNEPKLEANNHHEGGMKQKGGCGRFPTAGLDQPEMNTGQKGAVGGGQSKQIGGPQQQQQQQYLIEPRRNRSPDTMSECSQHSAMSTASSRPSLPQPAPRHNIRDQLINAGYRVSRPMPSFFGGAANNPFFGQSQQRQQPSSLPFRSNSPNFPSTNTVIARVSELENKQQQQQKPPNGQQSGPLQLDGHSHQQPSSQLLFSPQMREATTANLTVRPSPPQNGGGGGGQLSPRSTVFRTKPVIFLEDQQMPRAADKTGKMEKKKGEKEEKLANDGKRRGATSIIKGSNNNNIAAQQSAKENKMVPKQQQADEQQRKQAAIKIGTNQKDFQWLLMPAARESAARRLNSLNNATAATSEKNNQKEQRNGSGANHVHRRQRPQHKGANPFVAAKFPVIDEDLLALATRKGANGTAANPPPNLCRLITNVSECRWTAKRPSSPRQQIERREGGEEDNGEGESPKFVMRRDAQQQTMATTAASSQCAKNSLAPNAADIVAFRRLSALSMVSSVSSYGGGPGGIDDAANCDCTSLAMSAFRRSSYGNLSGKRRKQAQQLQRKNAAGCKTAVDMDDSYRKISPSSSSSAPNSGGGAAANDSGISSSSDSSRSTSLSEGAAHLANQPKVAPPRNCTNCGRRFLPPSIKRTQPTEKTAAALLSRRKRALNYLLGNMMRLLEMPSKKCQCNRCGGAGMNLKLMSSPQTTIAPTAMANVPMINIEMAAGNDQETDSPKSSPRDASPGRNIAAGAAADENRSPRWRSDIHNEAILPAYKKAEKKLQKTPEGIVERRESSPTVSATAKRQSEIVAIENKPAPHHQQNGHVQKGEKHAAPSVSPSSAFAVIPQTNAQKLQPEFGADEPIKLATAKNEPATAQIAPPPYYQQRKEEEESGREKKKKMEGEEEEDLEAAYANAVKRSRISGRLSGMPKFHFPLGKPIGKAENDKKLAHIRELFESHPAGQLPMEEFDELCKRMDFAVYTKRAVYDACCQLNGLPVLPPLINAPGAVGMPTSPAENAASSEAASPPEIAPIDFNQFCVYWNRMISDAHDEASRFVFTLYAASARFGNQHHQQEKAGTGTMASSARHHNQYLYLLREDFLPMMMDLILTHPGLHFLKDAPQFYSKYCEVVIVRIYWNVNRSWTGRLTANELRHSNFLQTLRLLDDVTDINKVTEYFSYEHFYVTYCKFWELDTDHDMVISRDDMRRHCNGALTDRIIDRIFSAAVIRTPAEQRTVAHPGPIRQQPIETIGFEDFVCFLLAEEDKRHATSTEYWFRCVDLDGDGQISLYEMEYFYEGIEQKLIAKNMETLALRDVICNLLDSISPANGFSMTRNDLKKSGLAHRFFNTFVNWIKYVDQESSDGERASVKTTGDKEISDWEVFCLTEYELLMAESEQMSNEGDEPEENIDVILDDEDDELMPSSIVVAMTAEEEQRGGGGGEQRLNGFLQQKQQQKGKATAAV